MKRRTWVVIIVLVSLPLILFVWHINTASLPVVNDSASRPETRIRITFEKPGEADLIQQFDKERAAWIASLAAWQAMPPFAGFTARWDELQPCPTWSTLADATYFWDLPLATPEEPIPIRYWRIQSCVIYQEP